ncbi:hypothetical protein [Rhodococcus jostii]|uniref:hypothetical protein n=1 Tax=Rhodococcus jostii TaxID=132919 RepID=UPI0036257A1C
MGREPADLDGAFNAWRDTLLRIGTMSAEEAAAQPELYRFRILAVERVDDRTARVLTEFPDNAVYALRDLPPGVRQVAVMLPLVDEDGESTVSPGMDARFVAFLATHGIKQETILGYDDSGIMLVRWDY